MRLSAEAHRAVHRTAQRSLVLVMALYERSAGQDQGERTLRDLFEAVPRWWPVPYSAVVEDAWRVWDQTLACYIHAEWPGPRLMTAKAGILESTTLAQFLAWNGRMGVEAGAIGEEEATDG